MSVLSADLQPAALPESVVDASVVLERCARKSWHQGIAFRSWGEGPALVLIHGGVGSWTHWVRSIAPLATRFTVHAMDLPGFGESPDVPADAGPDGYLDWVAEAVKDVALVSPGGNVVVVGFSFGGVVAAAVTGRLGSLARRLTLIGPGGFGEPVGRSIPVRKRPKGGDDMRLLREVTAYNLGQWMLSELPAVDDPVIDLHLANLARARYDSRLIGWRPTLLPDLARTPCPVQILWGDGDRLAHPSVQERWAMCQATRPDLQGAVIPDCGHWAQYARPEAIHEHLLAFHGRSVNDSEHH